MGWRETSVVTNIVVTYGTGVTGLFQYSGAPHHGNPPIAWSVPSGVTKDPYGNTLPVSGGFASLAPSSGLLAALEAGNLSMWGESPAAYVTPGSIGVNSGGSNLVLLSPKMAGQNQAAITLEGAAAPLIALQTSPAGTVLASSTAVTPSTSAQLEVQGTAALQNASAPTAVSGYAQPYAATGGQLAVVNGQGLTQNLSGAQLADVAGHTVTAATLTAITNAWTVPANDPVAGTVYELTAFGHGTQGSTAETLEFAALHGGTTIFTFTFPALFAAASAAFAWKLTLRVVIGSTGVTGTYFAELDGLAGSGGTSNPVPGLGGTLGAHTIDTTSAGTFSLQAAWGSAAVGATVTCDANYFKRIA